MAQLYPNPVATATAPDVRPVTWTGTAESSLVPFPS